MRTLGQALQATHDSIGYSVDMIVVECCDTHTKDKKNVKNLITNCREVFEFIRSQNRLEKQQIYDLDRLNRKHESLMKELKKEYDSLQRYETVVLALCDEILGDFWDEHLRQLEGTLQDFRSIIRGHFNNDELLINALKENYSEAELDSIHKQMEKSLPFREKMLRAKHSLPSSFKQARPPGHKLMKTLSAIALPITKKKKYDGL
jgi:hypothetical protein